MVDYAKCQGARAACCNNLTKCEAFKAVLENLRKKLAFSNQKNGVANQTECKTIVYPQGWPSCNLPKGTSH